MIKKILFFVLASCQLSACALYDSDPASGTSHQIKGGDIIQGDAAVVECKKNVGCYHIQ